MKQILATTILLASLSNCGGPPPVDPAVTKLKLPRQLTETNECEGCGLTGANLQGANLQGAKFCETTMPDSKVNYSGC